MALTDVDEAAHRIAFQVDITMYWTDARLRWPDHLLKIFNITRDRRHSIPYVITRYSGVWKPELLNFEGITESASKLSAQRIVGYDDGFMRMRGEFYDERTCHILTRYFPFDRQCCPFTIGATNMATLSSQKPLQGFLDSYWVHLNGGVHDGDKNSQGFVLFFQTNTSRTKFYLGLDFRHPSVLSCTISEKSDGGYLKKCRINN